MAEVLAPEAELLAADADAEAAVALVLEGGEGSIPVVGQASWLD